jgi:serine/threonine protein phosphatase PrpC
MPNGQIDASNFLGSRRHILRQLGTRVMPADTRFLLVTDGFVDEYYEGHVPDERIGEILGAAATPQAVVQELQAACTVPDDATAIAIFGRA